MNVPVPAEYHCTLDDPENVAFRETESSCAQIEISAPILINGAGTKVNVTVSVTSGHTPLLTVDK
jgi:hypothetical protein